MSKKQRDRTDRIGTHSSTEAASTPSSKAPKDKRVRFYEPWEEIPQPISILFGRNLRKNYEAKPQGIPDKVVGPNGGKLVD